VICLLIFKRTYFILMVFREFRSAILGSGQFDSTWVIIKIQCRYWDQINQKASTLTNLIPFSMIGKASTDLVDSPTNSGSQTLKKRSKCSEDWNRWNSNFSRISTATTKGLTILLRMYVPSWKPILITNVFLCLLLANPMSKKSLKRTSQTRG